MKTTCKRVVLILLCLATMLTLFPITVSATNNYKLSDAGARMIQSFEGFAEYPVWDYAQYSVGYGSRCPDEDYERYMANGISRAEADKLFRNHIVSHENRVNSFANKNGLTLTQNQFDALVSFSYNVGAGWMSHPEYGITQAVLNGATGNEFIFAIGQWCNAGGKILTGLVKRRLAEANVYLNGEYKMPDNYKYVIYDHIDCVLENGEISTIKIQAYDAALGAAPVSVGYKDGYRFLGWYTEKDGDVCVDLLDDSFERGQKLYPKWQDGNGNIISNSILTGTASNYKRYAEVETPIYKNPSLWASVIGSVKADQEVDVIAEYVNQSGAKWGRISNNGWVNLAKFKQEAKLYPYTEARMIEEETVENDVKVVGTLIGADINIYETVLIKNQTWGKTDLGWLCLDYIDCVLF